MTVAQTTNHGLIYPNPDNPVPNWPQINQINSDKLDNLVHSPSIQSYTPSLAFSAGEPNIGDTGQILGKFVKIFDIYFYWIWIRMGDPNVDMGSGNTLRMTLPAAADRNNTYIFGNSGSCVGGGYFFDASAGFSRCPLSAKLSGSGDDVIFLVASINMNGRTNWILQGDNPAAMTDADQIEIYGKFKAAAA